MGNQGKFIDWGIASSVIPGETRSGDLSLVREFPDHALVAVMDGLGHGEDAAAAAETAVATLNEYVDEPVVSLMKRCHTTLLKTRGVVMTLARLNKKEKTMTWIGVGNVDGRVMRRNHESVLSAEAILLRGGVVGYQLPPLQPAVVRLRRDDMIIFFTDGIGGDISQHVDTQASPQQIADRILAQSTKGTDDALVVVVKYLGNEGTEEKS